MNIVKEFYYDRRGDTQISPIPLPISEQINNYLKEHPSYSIFQIKANYDEDKYKWWALVVFETNEEITSTETFPIDNTIEIDGTKIDLTEEDYEHLRWVINHILIDKVSKKFKTNDEKMYFHFKDKCYTKEEFTDFVRILTALFDKKFFNY